MFNNVTKPREWTLLLGHGKQDLKLPKNDNCLAHSKFNNVTKARERTLLLGHGKQDLKWPKNDNRLAHTLVCLTM